MMSKAMDKKRTVVIVVTLDTKAEAARFLREEIVSWGLETILIDPGILGEPGIEADITRWQVAESAGTTLEALIADGKKSLCIGKQTEGLCKIVGRLRSEGRLDGIIGLGGGQGTSMVTAAMRSLPLGVPKVMLSTIASGSFRFGPYVGTKDICMMHSVTDILDVNAISRPVLWNAANAISGMVWRGAAPQREEHPVIAITQLGMTTPCVMRIKSLLEPKGYQLVPFHASGAGGPGMEALAEEGRFVGIIDLSLHEVIDGIFNGIAGAHHRLESLARHRIPAVVSVGGNDYILFESLEKAPEQYRNRIHVVHNPQMTAIQPNVEEMIKAAQAIVDPLNRAIGPIVVLIPSLGFTEINQPGREFWLPDGNRAAIETLKNNLRPEIPVVVLDVHINDPVFADALADCMERLIAGEPPIEIAARYSHGN